MLKRADRVTAVIFALIGSYVLVESYYRLPYRAEYGPGPGFLPMVLGACMLLVSISLFSQTFFAGKYKDAPPVNQEAPFQDISRVVMVLSAFMVSILFLDILGFPLAYGLLVFSMLFALERSHMSFRAILLTSISLTTAFTLVFKFLLGVSLPSGILGI